MDENLALICKRIWKIISISDQSLWVRWVREELIKKRSFWNIPIPSNASWSWRKLLNLRSKIRPLIRYIIGNGKDTWLWFDPWHPCGPIRDRWGDRVIYDSGIPALAHVDTIIHNGAWRWPVASSHALLELKNYPLPSLPSNDVNDYVVWLPSSDGVFSTASAWEEMRNHHPKITWHHLIWDSPSIPRASFLAWLVVKGKLSTQDRLLNWGYINSIQCWLCDGDREDHDHLFCTCPYTRRVWSMGFRRFELHSLVSSFNDLLTYCISSFAGSSFRAKVGRLFFNTTIYWLWRERNNRLHCREKRNEIHLLGIIEDWMRGVMHRALDGPISSQDHFLARQWSLSSSSRPI